MFYQTTRLLSWLPIPQFSSSKCPASAQLGWLVFATLCKKLFRTAKRRL